MSTQFTGPVTVVSQGLYDTGTPAVHNYGELVFTNDGRAFRYFGAGGTDIVSGRLCQSKVENTSDQNLAVAAATAGDLSIVTTSTVTVDANEYSNGFVVVTAAAGSGKVYKIAGHAAAAAAVLTINLADPINVALTTSSKIDLVANPFKDLVINPTTATSNPVGVTVASVAANKFGWLGVSGPQPCLAEATAIVVGTPVVASTSIAGACSGAGQTYLGQVTIGMAMSGIAAGEVGLVDLTLI